MEIKYKFANGDVSLVEVSDEIGEMIIQSRRVEENGERKQRYHCYSLDGLDYEGEAFACADTPDDALIEKEGEAWIETFKATLTAPTKSKKSEEITLSNSMKRRGCYAENHSKASGKS